MNSKIKYVDDSPCILKCSLDRDNVCTGCFRSMDEITSWHKADAEKRAEFLENADRRKEAAKKI